MNPTTRATTATVVRRVIAAAGICALATLGTACGSSGGGTASEATGGVATPIGTPPGSGVADAGSGGTSDTDNMVEIDAIDMGPSMSFDINGSPKAGLVTISFVNVGQYAHEVGLAQLKDGVTLDQVKAALAKGEEAAQQLLVDPEGELTGPAIVGGGYQEQATVHLDAGHYVVTCFLPGPDGMPHVMMGMLGEFTVSGDQSAATPPETAGTVELTDSGIALPDGFGTGKTYAVTNSGTKPHDLSIAELDGKPLMTYFQCVGASFGKGTPIDDCPGTLHGGLTALQPGDTAYLTVTLPFGDYSYVSTQGDGADLQAGLHGEFTVG